MRCKRCGEGNESIGYYYHEIKKCTVYYCRRCVSERTHAFQYKIVRYLAVRKYQLLSKHCFSLRIPFPLTVAQRMAVFQLKAMRGKQKQLLLHAVCGAGKTEIVACFIAYAIKSGKSVGWGIARRDVVIELAERLRTYFPDTVVSALYQGSPDLGKVAQLTVLTTARLVAFVGKFDYLIIDENDAYPYNISQRQQFAASKAISRFGMIVHVSATILKKQRRLYHGIVTLANRFHGEELPLIRLQKFQLQDALERNCICTTLQTLLSTYLLQDFPVFLFVSSIDKAIAFTKVLQHTFPQEEILYVSSVVEDRTRLLNRVRNGSIRFVVTTTILERGVTFPNVQVLVLDADMPLFDGQTLIQIAGRVGRTFENPSGDIVFFYGEHRTWAMIKAMKYHKQASAGKVLFI